MAHIELNNQNPGILGLFQFSPVTSWPLQDLTETLLRMPSSLSQGERELIACYVSYLNKCEFCEKAHSSFASLYLKNRDLVEAVKTNPSSNLISPKLRALLKISAKVVESGLAVNVEDVTRAKVEGATDKEIHDVVLIAAAFCMFNRYVDGLATYAPKEDIFYQEIGKQITESGYRK